MTIELSGREVAIICACLRRSWGWDDAQELRRFVNVAREHVGDGFTDTEIDGVLEHFADAWRQAAG